VTRDADALAGQEKTHGLDEKRGVSVFGVR
jgi:hypothetical protein